MRFNKNIIILTFSLVALIMIIVNKVFITDQMNVKLSSEEMAIVDVYKLMDAVIIHPLGEMPKNDSFPSYLWVDDSCWYLLQDMAYKNSNRFRISMSNNYHPVEDAEEVTVDILFMGGHVVEVLYSQGGLAGCRAR